MTPRWLGTIPSLGSLLGIVEAEETADAAAESADKAARFGVGEYVEYHSASAGSWIPAKILADRDDGLYDLDCKQGVPPTKVRPASFAKPEFEVGASVEYLSDTQGVWIAAKVKMYNAIAGTYDLDCKQNVPPSRIRASAASTRPPSPEEVDSAKEVVAVGSEKAEEEFGGSHSSTCPVDLLQPQQDGPIQLVKVSRQGTSWHFELCPEAVKVLEACGREPIAVCTVCGPYRTGKSYLLNLLLGRVRQGNSKFRVGSTTRACTDGLWMWGFGRARGADSPSLLFLDCEGFGSTESDKTRDAKLMSLCMQLSSVFLLNTKGVLSESLFNALSLVCNMAEHFDEGQEASKPALLWVLRDFLLELIDDGKKLTPDEYLESTLHKKPPEGVDPQRSQAARDVRETLLRFFPHRHCATLCQPAIDEQQLRDLPEVPFEKLRLEFRKAFQELQNKLLSLTSSPKAVGGQPLSASQWMEMLRRLLSSLNEGHAMKVDDAWAQVQHTTSINLVAELRDKAAGELQKVRQGAPFPVPGGRSLPVSNTILTASLKECRRAIREEFRSRAVGDESMKAAHWKELKSALHDDEQMLRHLNDELADTALRQPGTDWAAWLSQEEAAPSDPKSEALLHALEKDLPVQPLARAAWEALSCSRTARLKWDSTLEATKAELKLAKEELEHKAALAAAVQAAAAQKLEGQEQEKNREMNQLQSQVETLQQQARAAIERERALKEQVLLAEEAVRKELHSRNEASRQSEQRIQELQAQVAELRTEVLQLQEKRHETSASPRDIRPKCACSVM